MSWSPDLFIGEMRPWPDSVHVVRGNTDETRRYFPEHKDWQEALERRIDELCAEVERGKAEFKKMDAWHSQELKAAMDENAKLVVKLNAEHIVRQNVEIENAKLRELARRLLDEYRYMHVRPRRMYLEHETRMRIIEDEMRSLGIEVTA